MTEKPAENSKSIVRNSIYGFSTWLLPLALSFVATPIIVKSLGHEDYGIYALVLGFIAYSFNFNVGRAITKYIAEYRAVGEIEKITEVISATLFINLALGGAGLLIIFSTANLLVADVLKIQADSQEKSVNALYIAGLTIFFLMLNQVFNAIVQGLHRFDVYAKIFNFNNILLISGNLILALKGFGLLYLLSWNLLITALSATISAITAKQLLPEFSLNLKFRRETLKLVFGYSSGVIAYQILANILLLFERGWITGKLGTESLTFYVVPMQLALYIHGFISSLLLVIFPLASALKNEREKLLQLYQKATKIVSFLAVFLGASLIVQSKPFLTLWIGADFAEKSSVLLILHTLTFSLLAIEIVAWQMTEGLGYPNYNCYLFVICFVISISGMVWLLPDYGSFGVAFARMIGFSTLFFSIFFVERLFFGKIYLRFWLKLFGVLTVSTILAVIIQSFLTAKLGVNWFSLIFSGAVGGMAYCLTAWLLGFVTDDEIALLRRIIKR
jgi:O-antigen/teichoic acid export membrane protein